MDHIFLLNNMFQYISTIDAGNVCLVYNSCETEDVKTIYLIIN